MAIYNEDYQAKVACPFDPAHIVSELGYKKHVQYCASPNKKNFEKCAHNSLHWIPKGQMKDHLRSCPDFMYEVCAVKSELARAGQREPSPPVKPPAHLQSSSPRPRINSFRPLEEPLTPEDPEKNPHHYNQANIVRGPQQNLLAPADWKKLSNRATFEPLTKFQLQTMTKHERKRYNGCLVSWQKWRNEMEEKARNQRKSPVSKNPPKKSPEVITWTYLEPKRPVTSSSSNRPSTSVTTTSKASILPVPTSNPLKDQYRNAHLLYADQSGSQDNPLNGDPNNSSNRTTTTGQSYLNAPTPPPRRTTHSRNSSNPPIINPDITARITSSITNLTINQSVVNPIVVNPIVVNSIVANSNSNSYSKASKPTASYSKVSKPNEPYPTLSSTSIIGAQPTLPESHLFGTEEYRHSANALRTPSPTTSSTSEYIVLKSSTKEHIVPSSRAPRVPVAQLIDFD